MPSVIRIEPTKADMLIPKLRCAAYCRVSSSSEDQLNSYAAQIKYYSSIFEDSETEELVDIYADEGITGTSEDKRTEFKRLIADCRKGKIDRIYTKSISRYARNTKDCLESVRLLKALGVTIFFEKENIDTAKMTDEMMITIMGGLAQEESTSISQNQKWSIRKRMRNGAFDTSSVPLGYIKKDGRIVIDKANAETIRMIYSDYLHGMGIEAIANKLSRMDPMNGKLKKKWHNSTVEYILTNEKYAGKTLLQKSYSTDTVPVKRCINKGEREQYLVENTNEPIISEKDFYKVQDLLSRNRKQYYKPTPIESVFKKQLRCGICGSAYKRRVKRGKVYWVCYLHNQEASKCCSKPIPEDDINQAFISLANKLILHYKEILIPLQRGLNELNSIKFRGNIRVLDIRKDIAALKEQRHIIARLRRKGFMDEQKYNEQLSALEGKIRRQENELKRIAKADDNDEMLEQLDMLISCIEKKTSILIEFDSELFGEIVDRIIINGKAITFNLVSGLAFTENI